MTSKEIWEKYGGRKIKYDGAIGTLASINKEGILFICITQEDRDNSLESTNIPYGKWKERYYTEESHSEPMFSVEYTDIVYYDYQYVVDMYDSVLNRIEIINDDFIKF